MLGTGYCASERWGRALLFNLKPCALWSMSVRVLAIFDWGPPEWSHLKNKSISWTFFSPKQTLINPITLPFYLLIPTQCEISHPKEDFTTKENKLGFVRLEINKINLSSHKCNLSFDQKKWKWTAESSDWFKVIAFWLDG